jgi:ethanolamine ammonia-lyase small subunit
MPDFTPSRTSPSLTTTARLSLGTHRGAVSTHEHLRFQLDHALARDAVHAELDVPLLQRGLHQRGLEGLALRSAVPDRKSFLLRPDLGRTLDPGSVTLLKESVILSEACRNASSRDAQLKDPDAARPAHTAPSLSSEDSRSKGSILFLLADGLSALAVERHALPLLDATLPLLSSILHPQIPVVSNARVAIADPIGQLLGAQMTVLLIGERPGLSSPDSLGVYLTWDPRPGRTDAERNCISNIRAEGLSYAEAAHRIAHYIREAQRLHTTGIALKDPTNTPSLPSEKPLP